jgi:hypothetical protein
MLINKNILITIVVPIVVCTVAVTHMYYIVFAIVLAMRVKFG